MLIGVIVELVIAYAQFLVATVRVPGFTIPSEWNDPREYASWMMLDDGPAGALFPALRDYRLYFSLVCVGLPFLLFVGTVVGLNSYAVILWYAVLLFGGAAAVVGLSSYFLTDTVDIVLDMSSVAAIATAAVGVVIVIVCTVLGIVLRKRVNTEDDDDDGDAITEDEVVAAATANVRWALLGQRLLAAFLLAVAGIAAILFRDEGTWQRRFTHSDLSNMIAAAGAVAVLVGALLVAWALVALCRPGRVAQWHTGQFAQRYFMRAVMFVMSLLYLPVGAGVIRMLDCRSFTCDTGSAFAGFGTGLAISTSGCSACAIAPGQLCPAAFAAEVCNGTTTKRLLEDPLIACDDVKKLFWPAAIGMGLLYLVGIPALYHQLIMVVTHMLQLDFPFFLPPDEALDDREIWDIKTHSSTNVGGFLYQPFTLGSRFTRLFMLVQKLMVVFLATYVIPYNNGNFTNTVFALLLTALTHLLFCGMLVPVKPFVGTFENVAAGVLMLTVVVFTGLAALVASDMNIPQYALIPPMVWVFLLAFVCLVIGAVLTYRRYQHDREVRERRFDELRAAEARRRGIRQRARRSTFFSPTPHVVTGTKNPLESAPGSQGPEAEPEGPPLSFMERHRRRAEEREGKKAEIEAIAQRHAESKLSQEEQELLDDQIACDRVINRTVRSRLNRICIVFGFVNTLILAVTAMALLQANDKLPRKPTAADVDPDVQIAGHVSWAAFTQDCCCTAQGDLEQWRCATGPIVERRRVAGDTSGLAVRPMCNVTFTPGCSVAVSSDGVTFACASSVAATAAQKSLW